MPAAGCAGAAEAAAAPPPKPQPRSQHIARGGPTRFTGVDHISTLPIRRESLYLCTAGSRTAALHLPPVFVTHPHVSPGTRLRGSAVSHQAVMILRRKASVVQRKDFRVLFLFCFFFLFISRFHLERFDGWCFFLWHSERKDLWRIDRDGVEKSTPTATWVIHSTPHLKAGLAQTAWYEAKTL